MTLRKTIKIITALALVICCAFTLACCNNTETENNQGTTAAVIPDYEIIRPEVNKNVKDDKENAVGYQLESPKEGDTIAIIHTSMGDITWRFFPENAPKAVENFIQLAKAGKYDNTIFHRVIDDFMIQGGDYEKADGTGGKSYTGTAFEDEFCNTLFNIRGSVSMANSGPNTNGSQFFINQAGADSFSENSIPDFDTTFKYLAEDFYKVAASDSALLESYGDIHGYIKSYQEIYGYPIFPLSYAVTDEIMDLYRENGGNIHLDGALRADRGHTVFAQVIDGMDVVDAIAAVKVNAESNKPLEDVKIVSVEITTYTAE